MNPSRFVLRLLLLEMAGLLLLPTNLGAQPSPNGAPQGSSAATVPAAADLPAKMLEPVPFASRDGKVKGWKVVIPGSRPLATPAVADGKVFLGGGFGSHEFYAFDALTGKKVWQYQTKDDGPTAAAVQDGYIAFNTESCELEIIASSGKPVWKKWLGDPLMSMPASAGSKVYMAYPDSRGDHKHYLGCFDLKTGKEFWKKAIAGEIISAPVVANEHVYLATLEGTVYCFGQHDGELVWKDKKNATSAPVVWNGRCYFSRREEVAQASAGKKTTQQTEQLAARGLGVKDDTSNYVATARPADYLDFNKRMHSPVEKANQMKDGAVGFAAGNFNPAGSFTGGFSGGLGALGGLGGGFGGQGGGKGDAKIHQAMGNLGQGSVVGVWSYQGSKPFVSKGRLYNAMGDTLQAVDAKTAKVVWKRTFASKEGKEKDQKGLLNSVLTPPVLVNEKVFVASLDGEVFCLAAESGKVLWSASIHEPVLFQPAVVKGRVYISTGSGVLYCLETGDSKDDGWTMWGGSAAHNGIPK
jgi:Ca-activated chloride channel family protein